MNNKYWIILTAILIAIILFLQQCGNKKGVSVNKLIKTDTVMSIQWKHDTVPHNIYLNKYSIKDIPVLIPVKVDTAAILRKFYTKEAINDSIHDDTIAALIVDTLFQNTILFRKFTYKLKLPTEIITKTITNTMAESPKLKFYGGLEMGGNLNTFDFSPELELLDKKNHAYIVRYGVISKTYNFGLLIKL